MSGRVRDTAQRVWSITNRVLLYILIWAGFTLLAAAISIRFYWGPITVDQMMLNLVSVQGEGGGGTLVLICILGIGVLPVMLTAGIAYWRFRIRRKRRASAVTVDAAVVDSGTSDGPTPPSEDETEPLRRSWAKVWFARTVSLVMVAALVTTGTVMFGNSVHFVDYVRSVNSAYAVDDYYETPVVASAEKKRNLVMIYLESGEETLSDTTLFDKDPFVPLKEATPAEDGWQQVEGLRQYEGGGWTMAGISGTQCGVPLKGSGLLTGKSGLNSLGGELDSYLGGLTCVGDILSEQGYRNVFMGGAEESFAAKDQYFLSHGYGEFYGLNHWKELGEPADQIRSDWGLSDKRLMERAKDQVDTLHVESERTGGPFNLTMLTVDTHEPAHLYDYCPQDTESEVTSMFNCSMTQVAGFIDHLEAQGYLDDTAVVIMGDHLKHMGASNAFHEQLDDNPNRTIFNRFWIPGDDRRTSTMQGGVDQLNMMPTILEAAGIELADRQGGLGVSAFTVDIPRESAQRLEPDAYNELLNSRSTDFYNDAWDGQELKKK
ncbi:MAG: LTA synthase family protein [Corynebacterium variabile]|uniref:LTA synthase family protein n=2 Tax=Corynebacterium variabile TaxID=1727 RepID=UPI00264945EA|nr:LTA synthase family protein [Corynebacterium variabile]MDN6844897.1 LTA synthase family protein [Corynebacterium variabile]